jgi:CRISPR-associated protein Csx14
MQYNNEGYMQPNAAFVATLGGQPQIVTLALDCLLAQGAPITDVFVVHLARSTPRYQDALQILAQEFAGDCYGSRRIRYRPMAIAYGINEIEDLIHPQAMDATQNRFEQIFPTLKQQGYIIHLCPTGGRRMLGMLALVAAQMSFDRLDRVWHLYSSDTIRQQTDRGALLHVPMPESDLSLLPIPFQPWGQMLAGLRIGAAQVEQRMSAEQRQRCQSVWARLNERPRDVLRVLAQTYSLQEAALQLHIEISTIHAHKTTIFNECMIAWELDQRPGLDA